MFVVKTVIFLDIVWFLGLILELFLGVLIMLMVASLYYSWRSVLNQAAIYCVFDIFYVEVLFRSTLGGEQFYVKQQICIGGYRSST